MSITVGFSTHDREVAKLFSDENFSIISRAENADIVVFPGGEDVNPELYGETKAHRTVNLNLMRDKLDCEVWRATRKKQLKVGIGRGAQFLNVMNGGKLYQHVSGHVGDHYIYNTLDHSLMRVDSTHHQMMIPTDKAEILGYSENVGKAFYREGINPVVFPKFESEIVWYDDTNCLCYQPRPERARDYSQKSHFLALVGLLR